MMSLITASLNGLFTPEAAPPPSSVLVGRSPQNCGGMWRSSPSACWPSCGEREAGRAARRSHSGKAERGREGQAAWGICGSRGAETHRTPVAAVTPGTWPLLCHPDGPDPALRDLSRPHSGQGLSTTALGDVLAKTFHALAWPTSGWLGRGNSRLGPGGRGVTGPHLPWLQVRVAAGVRGGHTCGKEPGSFWARLAHPGESQPCLDSGTVRTSLSRRSA